MLGNEVSSLGDIHSYSTPTAMSPKNSVLSTSTSSSNHHDSKQQSPPTTKQGQEKKGDERRVPEARQSEHTSSTSGSAARLSIREFYESALASQQARGRGSSPRRREIFRSSRGAASPWMIEDTTIEMIYKTPARRAKSTPRERRPSATLVTPASSSHAASTAKTPSTAGTSSTTRRGRSRSPFRRWRKAEDLVKDVRRKEELAAVAATPSTAASSSRLSTATTRASSLESPTTSSQQQTHKESEPISLSPI